MKEAGRLGGAATKARHRHEHYVTIGKKGGSSTRKKFGHDHFVRIGQLGGKRKAQVEANAAANEELIL